MGVDDSVGHEQGAGDQGMCLGTQPMKLLNTCPSHCFGASFGKTIGRSPQKWNAIVFASDGKTQVTCEYNDDGSLKRVDKVLVSCQHSPQVSNDVIHNDIINHVIKAIIPSNYLDESTEILVNPTGRFVIGGPSGDSGLTGRKIIVDTYGGRAHHGGGAFSGKDPSKVDRSAAYAARYVAKNLVAADWPMK
jgi:S-adenosylmethionine synthetase